MGLRVVPEEMVNEACGIVKIVATKVHLVPMGGHVWCCK